MENNHYIENRPWGSYEILTEFKVTEPGYSDVCVKKLIIKPTQRISYQSHKFRYEHWFIVQGQGNVILNDKEIPVRVGDFIDIKIGDKHRAINTSNTDNLVLIETQTGHYDEADIVRYEADYDLNRKTEYRGKFAN